MSSFVIGNRVSRGVTMPTATRLELDGSNLVLTSPPRDTRTVHAPAVYRSPTAGEARAARLKPQPPPTRHLRSGPRYQTRQRKCTVSDRNLTSQARGNQ